MVIIYNLSYMYKIKSNLKLFFFNIHAIYDKLIKIMS